MISKKKYKLFPRPKYADRSIINSFSSYIIA